MTLRLRLTLFYSAFFALILAAVAFAVYALTSRSLTEALETRALHALDDLKRMGRRLATSSGNQDGGIGRLPGDAYYEINLYPLGLGDRPSGEDLTRGARISPPFLSTNPSPEVLIQLFGLDELDDLLWEGRVMTSVGLGAGRLLVAASRGRYYVRPGTSFEATLVVGIPASGVDGTLARLANDLGLTVLLAFALFAIGVWLLSHQVLSPVQRVTQAAARVTGKALSQRVPVPRSKDEMRELAVTINHMLDRLQESFETQRRFTADASHELRTPVTAIVGHTNYLLRRTKPKPEQVDSLTVIRREAERMAKLVNDLLELARADAGFSIDMESTNLVDLVEAVHMEIAPVAGNTVIEVRSAQPLIQVMGDPARLKQVVLNLVQNAVNAGASVVTVALSLQRQEILMEILDNGPGIPADAIPHLFERFFRVDGARSGRGNGSGLGLAIVRWIVQQHGGTVEVDSRPGEGSVFTVRLPALDGRSSEVRALRQTVVEPAPLSRVGRG